MIISQCGLCYRLFQCHRLLQSRLLNPVKQRGLLTIAIESSCDDTCVAVLEKHDVSPKIRIGQSINCLATLYFHEKITADNTQYGGIHPLEALYSHQHNLSSLVSKALRHLPSAPDMVKHPWNAIMIRTDAQWQLKKKPDFVSVTRGPGMRSNLATGIDTAKGLATAWQVPILGINHMQAHALTPRLVSALGADSEEPPQPGFPFLSLLVSGGHTLLLRSAGLVDHTILATTMDIAIGDAIDKMARSVLPVDLLEASETAMYGSTLEQYAFPNGGADYNYKPPMTYSNELATIMTRWGWGLSVPLARRKSGLGTKAMEYSFSGLESAVKRLLNDKEIGPYSDERRDLAREAMRVAFEHLASRVVMALQVSKADDDRAEETLVVSGGVASNSYLQEMQVVAES